MKRLLSIVALLGFALSCASPALAARVPKFDHVVIIMLENHGNTSIVGNPNAPQITKLAKTYGYGAEYYGVTHPSLPNYVALTSGNNWYSNSDNPTQRFNHVNIVDQFEAHHISWKAYMQSLPSAGYDGNFAPAGAKDPLYVIRHDPFMLYRDVRRSPARRKHVVPLRQLSKDLSAGDLPQYAWISPNVCHDMHGMDGSACPYSNDAKLKRLGDEFVATWVHRIMSSKSWTKRSVIFITTDETDYDGGNKATGGWLNAYGCCDSPSVPKGAPFFPSGGMYGGGIIPLVVISGVGKPHFVSHRKYNHYAMLRTIEESWGLPFLGMAGDNINVHAMSDFFIQR